MLINTSLTGNLKHDLCIINKQCIIIHIPFLCIVGSWGKKSCPEVYVKDGTTDWSILLFEIVDLYI